MKYIMKNPAPFITLCSLLLSTLVLSKKTYTLTQSNQDVRKALKATPTVSSYDCTECIWNDGVNYACVDHSVNLDLGWEFDQTYAIDSSTSVSQYYWQIRFAPYVQTDAIIHPELYID